MGDKFTNRPRGATVHVRALGVAILQYMHRNPGRVTCQGMADQLGRSRDRVATAMRWLRDGGKVHVAGRGKASGFELGSGEAGS